MLSSSVFGVVVIVMALGFPSAEAITVTVACGGKTGRSGRHKVTIGTDWSVETGHDLELERIASAFGSTISCVDLADRRLPCVRQVWLHRQRLVPPGIRRSRSGVWEVTEPARGCGCLVGGATWQRPDGAAAHVRTLQHWARAFGVDVAACNRLIVSIERATGAAFDGVRRVWPRSEAVHHHLDFAWLWEVGLAPEEVERIHAGLGLGEALTPIGYLYVSSSGAPLEELLPYAADGAEAVCWAASSWLEHRTLTPDARREWFLSRLHWRLISALASGPFTLADVRELAAATGKSLNQSADLLASWLAAGCHPSLAEVIEVCRLVPHGRQAPASGALDAMANGVGAHQLTRIEMGQILVAAGTPTTAIALVARGVRSLGAAVSELAGARSGR